MGSKTRVYSDGRTIVEVVTCENNYQWFLLQRILSILTNKEVVK